ncbi:unnamed protein product [Euphydryas editha]|uniref:Protein tyrosine phosphatase n=1 Tax=Euphydryas editha TaxID=104508 RepID=A0AAU9UU72_EUPED|nr:unnamed protein product [Euphydryas editha]
MYSSEERLELAAEVLKLKERVHNLKSKKPKLEKTSEEIDQKINIAKQKYEDKKRKKTDQALHVCGLARQWSTFQLGIGDIDEERERLLAKIQDVPALGPIIVHCSAGVGRTGVFCAVDSCLSQLLKTKTISVPETVLKIRQQRYSSVPATEQYVFIYRILYEFVKQFETCSVKKNSMCVG